MPSKIVDTNSETDGRYEYMVDAWYKRLNICSELISMYIRSHSEASFFSNSEATRNYFSVDLVHPDLCQTTNSHRMQITENDWQW